MPIATREQWLQRAVRDFRPFFLAHSATLPDVQVSCGFPSTGGTRARKRAIGECHDASRAADAKPHILVTPTLSAPLDVLAVLMHECVHAAVGNAAGHGPKFRTLAIALGLEGKMSATVPGAALTARLTVLAESIGPYPHGAIDLSSRKKQGTRLLKAQCPECGAIIRLSAKVANAPGLPVCACSAFPNQATFVLAASVDAEAVSV